MGEERPAVVKIQNAYKRYTAKTIVLRGLSMTIEKGTIYGLLGPSGCGKTTLLSCIVGRQNFDSGSIQITCSHRRQIGYMPQDICLNLEMTVQEMLNYYGRLYEMEWKDIEKRSVELISFLQLPDKDRFVSDCRIWECFIELVNRDKTVVITTHYIEEAKNAHQIGLMRNGVLLIEEPPQAVIRRFSANTLEEAFLALSKIQDNQGKRAGQPDSQAIEDAFKKPPPPPVFEDKDLWNAKRFAACFWKNLSWSRRNLGVTLFVCFIPTMCLFLVLLQEVEHTVTAPIALGVRSHVNCSPKALALLPKVRPCLMPGQDFVCMYHEILNAKYPAEMYSEEEAIERALKGWNIAVVMFSQNFSDAFMERIQLQRDASSKAIDQGTLEVSADTTAFLSAIFALRWIYVSVEELIEEICRQCGYDERIARLPLEVQEPVHGGGPGFRLQYSYLPSVICPFVFFVTFMYTSSSLSMDKTTGLLERYRTAGLTIVELLTSLLATQIIIINIQNFLMFTTAYGIYGAIMEGSFFTIYIATVFCQLFGMSFGVFIGLLLNNETAVSMTGAASAYFSFILCGTYFNMFLWLWFGDCLLRVLWPIDGQHWVVRIIGRLVPLTHTTNSYFNVSLRGWGISNPEVYLGFFSSFAGSIFLLGLTYLLSKRNLITI